MSALGLMSPVKSRMALMRVLSAPQASLYLSLPPNSSRKNELMLPALAPERTMSFRTVMGSKFRASAVATRFVSMVEHQCGDDSCLWRHRPAPHLLRVRENVVRSVCAGAAESNPVSGSDLRAARAPARQPPLPRISNRQRLFAPAHQIINRCTGGKIDVQKNKAAPPWAVSHVAYRTLRPPADRYKRSSYVEPTAELSCLSRRSSAVLLLCAIVWSRSASSRRVESSESRCI